MSFILYALSCFIDWLLHLSHFSWPYYSINLYKCKEQGVQVKWHHDFDHFSRFLFPLFEVQVLLGGAYRPTDFKSEITLFWTWKRPSNGFSVTRSGDLLWNCSKRGKNATKNAKMMVYKKRLIDHHTWCVHQGSNPKSKFRRLMWYPFHYGRKVDYFFGGIIKPATFRSEDHCDIHFTIGACFVEFVMSVFVAGCNGKDV